MANSSASSFTFGTKRKVTTVECFDWDAEEGKWKPTNKSVTTEDTPPDAVPYVTPWRDHQPYRPYYPQYPPFGGPGIINC